MTMILIGIIISLAGAAFFAGAETAMVVLFKKKETSARLPDRIKKWLDRPEEIFSVTLIGTNLCIITASSLSTVYFVEHFKGNAELYSLLIISLVTLIFCEVLPKSRALAGPESFAKFAVAPLDVAGVILKPVSAITNFIARGIVVYVRKIFKPASPPSWREFEIVAREGQLDIGSRRQSMLLLIFEASKYTAFDVMVNRSSFPFVTIGLSVEKALETAKALPSEYLVVESDPGEILGFVRTEDLTGSRSGKVEDLVHLAFYFPEEAKLLKLFSMMVSKDLNFAFIVDNHGSITGAVTYELIEDFLFGIKRTYRTSPSEASHLLRGDVSIEELATAIGVDIPRGPFKTLGGFLEEIAHGIPKKGEVVLWENLQFIVQDRTPRKVLSVRIEQAKKLQH